MATFRKTPAGHWTAIIRKKGFKDIYKTFAKKSVAVRWANDMEYKLARNAVTPAADKTLLSAVIAKYLAQFTVRKRASQSETSHLNTVSRALGHYTLSELKPAVIVDFVDERLESVGADTVRKELAKLSVVIDASIALWGVDLAANPVVTAKTVLRVTKTLAPGKRRDRRPSVEELAVLYQSRVGALVEFAVDTAMRRGEIASILPRHIHETTLDIPETKTDVSRTIPLTLRARELLSAALLENPQDDGDIEFPVWGLRPDSISQAFSRVCADNDIVDLRFHDLRHEGTSRLFERGLEIQQVAAITGHEDWQSLKRYTHLCPIGLAELVG